LKLVLKVPRWRRALIIAIVSDILSFGLVLFPPVQWGVDAATAFLLFIALGFRWGFLGALIVEAIPAIQVFPAWTLVVLAIAASEDVKP